MAGDLAGDLAGEFQRRAARRGRPLNGLTRGRLEAEAGRCAQALEHVEMMLTVERRLKSKRLASPFSEAEARALEGYEARGVCAPPQARQIERLFTDRKIVELYWKICNTNRKQ